MDMRNNLPKSMQKYAHMIKWIDLCNDGEDFYEIWLKDDYENENAGQLIYGDNIRDAVSQLKLCRKIK